MNAVKNLLLKRALGQNGNTPFGQLNRSEMMMANAPTGNTPFPQLNYSESMMGNTPFGQMNNSELMMLMNNAPSGNRMGNGMGNVSNNNMSIFQMLSDAQNKMTPAPTDNGMGNIEADTLKYLEENARKQQEKIYEDMRIKNQTPIIDPIINYIDDYIQG